jgi:hypothetical protein
MCFNEDKCKVMFIDRRHNNLLNTAFSSDNDDDKFDPLTGHRIFTMTGQNGLVHHLEESATERDLGILINTKLKWDDQIAFAKARAYGMLGTLKRTFNYWSIDSFRTLYVAFVRPLLEYCSSAWNPYYIKDIRAIESVQRNATKLVPELRHLEYIDRLKALNLPSLEHRRRRGDLIQFFKIVKGLNLVNFVKPNTAMSSLSTEGPARSVRGARHRIVRERIVNCAQREHFLTNRVMPDWNSLPDHIVNLNSLNSFKNEIDKHFFNFRFDVTFSLP